MKISPMGSQDVCGASAQTSGMKNIASAIFFILSDHAARKSGTLKRFRAGENGEESQEVCAPAQTSGVKEMLSRIFFTLYTSDKSDRIGR